MRNDITHTKTLIALHTDNAQSILGLAFIIHRDSTNTMTPYDMDYLLSLLQPCVQEIHVEMDSQCRRPVIQRFDIFFIHSLNEVCEMRHLITTTNPTPNYFSRGCSSRDDVSMVANLMMTSSNGNIFRVAGHLCGEFTGPRWIPHTKASDAELWCLFWSASE